MMLVLFIDNLSYKHKNPALPVRRAGKSFPFNNFGRSQ